MDPEETRWIVRLRPAPGRRVEDLLALRLGLDVWERQGDSLVVAASESQLREIARGGLADAERIETVADYLARQSRPDP